MVELLTIKDECLPSVECSRERLTKCRNNILESKLLLHLLEDFLITASICLATLNICIWLEAKAKLSILLITDAYINILHQRTHDRDSLLARPQFLTEVKVNAYSNAMTFSCFTSKTCQFGCLVRDSWSDA